MALKKEDITKLATLAKITVAELEKAIADAVEIAIPIPDKLTVFTEDEVNTLQKNKYDAGRVAGVEIAVKEAREKLGLDFTGKTIDGLVDAASKKALADAGKNPDAQVKEMQTKVDNLQKTVQDYELKIADKDSALSGLRDTYELGKHVIGPKEGGPSYSNDEIIQIMKMNGYDFKRNDKGVLEPYKNGEKLLDKISNPVPVGEVIKGFQKERKYIGDDEDTPGGRGKKDQSGGGKMTKQSELKAKFQAEGKSLNGEEYSKAVEQAVTADPNFDMNA
jgi:hypothetical protein